MTEPVKEAARTFLSGRRRQVESLKHATDLSLPRVRAGAPWEALLAAVADALAVRGVDPSWIRVGRAASLPGAYGLGRSAWDLAVFKDDIPLAAVAFKALGGPTIGNNFNNRIQELTSNAFAVRQGNGQQVDEFPPYLGIFFILEGGERADKPIRMRNERGTGSVETASYKVRLGETFRQFCVDGLYDGISYVSVGIGEDPSFEEPRPDMSVDALIGGLAERVLSYAAALSPAVPVHPASRASSADGRIKLISILGQYEEVFRAARGERQDYALDRLPMGQGGQAHVFRAVHKPSRIAVAFKRRFSRRDLAVARMRREIDVSRLLNGHPHAMPILDASPDHDWFVMPLAEATAEARREQLGDAHRLRELVNSIASVLAEAHTTDWLHRDIKPSNILLLDGRWTLADWGIVRRPRGQTTVVGRTGVYIGTEGFAAPELSVDPHGATAASDIYSLGRLIAWALTGEMPQTNISLLPPPGPWRGVVRAATQHEPTQRPQNIDQLLALIEREFSVPHEQPVEQAASLLAAANTGEVTSADALLACVADHPDDYDLHLSVLIDFSPKLAGPSLSRNPRLANALIRALAQHVDGDGVRVVQFGDAARAVSWLHSLAAYAAERAEWDLLDEAVRSMCKWDESWDQWRAQDAIRPWLRSLTGGAASIVASALRDHPGSARHFAELADNRAVDGGIRQAVRTAATGSR
ncbi:protein kinase domain-containing protein [Streptomyces sp. NPDC054797]